MRPIPNLLLYPPLGMGRLTVGPPSGPPTQPVATLSQLVVPVIAIVAFFITVVGNFILIARTTRTYRAVSSVRKDPVTANAVEQKYFLHLADNDNFFVPQYFRGRLLWGDSNGAENTINFLDGKKYVTEEVKNEAYRQIRELTNWDPVRKEHLGLTLGQKWSRWFWYYFYPSRYPPIYADVPPNQTTHIDHIEKVDHIRNVGDIEEGGNVKKVDNIEQGGKVQKVGDIEQGGAVASASHIQKADGVTLSGPIIQASGVTQAGDINRAGNVGQAQNIGEAGNVAKAKDIGEGGNVGKVKDIAEADNVNKAKDIRIADRLHHLMEPPRRRHGDLENQLQRQHQEQQEQLQQHNRLVTMLLASVMGLWHHVHHRQGDDHGDQHQVQDVHQAMEEGNGGHQLDLANLRLHNAQGGHDQHNPLFEEEDEEGRAPTVYRSFRSRYSD